MEAFSYLQASGLVGQPTQVLLVDPDTANGNTATARGQLTRYHAIQSKLRYPVQAPASFFSDPVNPDDPTSSVSWEYPTPPQPFQSVLQYAAQPAGTRGLLELLYDQNDLELSFEQGFVGRAHIGSFDVFRTFRAELETGRFGDDAVDAPNALVRFFRRVSSAAQGDGARVVVVGSLFGGTGASALPVIPPLMKDALADVQSGINAASVQLGPYFTFDAGGEHDPDSALHPLATQAALYHYSGSAEYDSIYFIGAPDRRKTSDGNQRGGPNQKNSAHYAELAAALAIRDFFQRPRGQFGKAVAAGGSAAEWSSFPSGDPNEFRRSMTAFSTAAYFHSVFLNDDLRKAHHRNHRWERTIRRAGDALGGGEEEIELLERFTTRYLNWAHDISRSTDRPLLDLAKPWDAARLGGLGQGGRADSNAYHKLFEVLNRVDSTPQTNPVGRYLHMLTVASREFCSEQYASWWREENGR